MPSPDEPSSQPVKLIFFMQKELKNLFLIGKSRSTRMDPILINEDMPEPSYNLKFMI